MIDSNLTGLDRVREAMRQLGLDVRIVSPGTPMPTVRLAAAAVGCSVDQIVKTVVFTTRDHRPVIAIANGARRIDRALLADAAAVQSLRLAAPDFVLHVTGFPAGGVSPLGIRDCEAPIYLDLAVLEQATVFAGAGTEDDLVELRTADLLRLQTVKVSAITVADSPDER
jgi:prolyl-tRNA editing enzyme YbaK/EbsC (Cys-tRNA(Pro) deacylase)